MNEKSILGQLNQQQVDLGHPYSAHHPDPISLLHVAILKIDQKVDDKFDKFEDKMDKVVEYITETKVLLEKITHIDDKLDDTTKRLHYRIDENTVTIKEILHRQTTEGCAVVRQVITRSDERVNTFKEKAIRMEEEIKEIKVKLKEIDDRPKVALGTFFKGALTALGTLFAGWLFTKGIK